MKKFLIYSLILFWWGLMFETNSYLTKSSSIQSSTNSYYLMINNKEIRFKVLDFLFEI